jgi:aryl-alcohol dehydrogenase-like predicted oxidoreductase
MAQHILQAGLAAGMSATAGLHSSTPKRVDPSFDDLEHVLPQSFIPTYESRVTFRGKHEDVQAPVISWGAWSWGDKATWGWSDEEMPALEQAWKLCLQKGMAFIDTAQAYGSGESERILGGLLKGAPRSQVFIQTKWYVVPDNSTNLFSPSKAPAKMLRGSLARLGLEYVDCYLVHGPIHASSMAQVAEGLAECVAEGLTKTVGVANYSTEDMLKMQAQLANYDIPLATNQCEFSILRRLPETSGLLRACRDKDIVFQSYSSLAQGRLTGKYTKDNPPPKENRFSSYPIEVLEPTLDVVESIAKAHDVSMSAVALNYNISKGVLPLAGIRKAQHAEQNMQALGWRLSNEEIQRIDSVSLEGKATKLWQQG